MAFFAAGATCGATFALDGKSVIDAVEKVDGWEVELRVGSETVLARGSGARSYDEAVDAALGTANKGLDLLSAHGRADHWIREASDQHIGWWHEGRRSVIRVISAPTRRVTVGAVTLTGGTTVPTPAPQWHESLRYFRLSQITDDLFDAYRNQYLALESILDHIAPQLKRPSGAPAEGEGDWFKRALGVAGTTVDLASFVPAGTADPVQTLWNDLYRDRRSALFHAKGSRAYLLPHNSEERLAVMESLRRVTSLYLALIQALLHIRRLGGGIFAGFWKMQIDAIAGRLQVAVTDDLSEFDPDDTVPNPSGGPTVSMKVAPAGEFDRPFERHFLGKLDGRKLRALTQVGRVVSLVDGEPYTGWVPDGDLRVEHVDRFELLLRLRAENVRQPKRRYAS
jgi:hypothetical protein